MANMIPISTVVVGSGGASTIAFNNIPQTYTDLLLSLSLRDTRASILDSECYISFNGGVGTVSSQRIFGRGYNPVIANTQTPLGIPTTSTSATASTFASSNIYITNYSGSNQKCIILDSVEESNVGNDIYSWLTVGLWNQTVPILNFSLAPYTGSFVQYSSATLYGIRKY